MYEGCKIKKQSLSYLQRLYKLSQVFDILSSITQESCL